MKIHNSLTELIGKTPLVRIENFEDGLKADVIAKCEFMNPLSSVKDRIALSMIEDAEASGRLTANHHIVEPTSGNTGIGLAFITAAKGYKLTLTMPDSMSEERRRLLKAFGAELVLTAGEKGMKGAIAAAEEIAASDKKYFMPAQFENAANYRIHEETTAVEIWDDTDGEVDVIVAGVGTGGTVTGIGGYFKQKKPTVEIIAVEPKDSPVLSGGNPGPHKIQGIGAGFIPKIYNREVVDRIITIDHEIAGQVARKAARTHGLLVGISSGAALAVAVDLARKEEYRDKKIVVIMPSSGERYLTTWLFADQ